MMEARRDQESASLGRLPQIEPEERKLLMPLIKTSIRKESLGAADISFGNSSKRFPHSILH